MNDIYKAFALTNPLFYVVMIPVLIFIGVMELFQCLLKTNLIDYIWYRLEHPFGLNEKQINITLRWLSEDHKHKYTENIRKFVQKQMDKKGIK